MTIEIDYMVNLEELGLLTVTGEDSSEFLQSQLTSDISTIEAGSAQFSSWCNPQGRIITTMLVINTGKHYILLLPRFLVDSIKKQISMYILRSRVSIDSHESPTGITGISGNALITQTMKYLENISDDCEMIIVAYPDGNHDRAILISQQKDLESLCENLSIKPDNTCFENWQYRDLLSGVVWVTPDTTNTLLPQDLGLEALGALSFNKGCFPGQEVIARLHYRGKAKYGLYLGNILDEEELPLPGQRLYLTDEGPSCGTIVSAVKIDTDTFFLASINHETSTADSYFIDKQRRIRTNFSAVEKK